MRPELECFNLKHRVFLVKNYYQYMGDYLCVKTKYEDQYKDSIEFPTFSYDIMMEIISLFERTGSVLKTQEGLPTATDSGSKPIERIFVKQEDELHVVEEQDTLKIPSTNNVQTEKVKDATEDMLSEAENPFSEDEDSNSHNTFQRTKSNQSKKYACNLCKESFSEFSDLKKHQIKMHVNENQTSVKVQDDEKGKESKEWRKTTQISRPLFKDSFTKEVSMDSASALQNTSMSDLGFLQLDQSNDAQQSLTGSAVTVSLDPYYDRKFNEITRKLDQLLKLQKGNTDLTGNDSGVDLNITFPVRTKEELDAINKNLADDEYRASFVRELSKVNGVSGTCDGNKAAYRLCDYIFNPYLLSLYNWTGSSKSGIAKECFNQYTNLIDVFGQIIMLADTRYSIAENEKFFKDKILKYSVMRSKRKRLH